MQTIKRKYVHGLLLPVGLSLLLSGCLKTNNDLLIEAASKGDMERIETLLDLGADINYRDGKGKTALAVAVSRNKLPAVKRLLSNDGKTVSQDLRYSAAGIAALAGYLPILKVLLDSGLDVNGKISTFSLLHLAAQSRNPEVARELLRRGVLVDVEDSNGETPLFHAAGPEGVRTLVEVFIEAGADVNKKNKYGNCPLTLALAENNHDSAALLRNAGAKECR
ncbi:MAG: ankyrin repeat domain-containing protein [Thermodesulfobacteriota bacterium]